WWGARPGPSGYQKMWKMLYDRYTNHHKLNNLIWVWNANGPIPGRKVPMDYELYYPGNEYVDVLAADIYRGDYKQSHHDELVELGKGKVIAMGEIGKVPPPEILDEQPKWTWFMIWARFPWSHNNPEEIKALYEHPKVLTKNEMDYKPGATGFNWDQYYKPSDKKRWYISPKEGPVAGNQNGKYLGPADLLPGNFYMTGTVNDVQKKSFNFLHDDCAWGKFTYRITPVNKIRFKSFSQAIPGQQKNINSRSIPVEDVAKVKTNLNLSGTVTEVVEEGKSFLAELNFAGNEPVKCRMELVNSAEVKRQPDVRLRYGPHWKHGMDIYYPEKKPEKPMAAVVYIHGGGWSALDKAAKGETAQWYNDHGLAYISVNYRYVGMHEEHPAAEPPVAASLLDAARAMQTIRYRAEELGIDPDRLGITGGSAGGATCTWLALHDDLANPDAEDPIERMSTKPTCAIPVQAQTSIDPKQMQEWIPSITYGAHAFFDRSILPEKGDGRFQFFLDRREEILPWIEEFSSYRHASADDPPMLLNYLMQKNTIPADDTGHATHHPRFGSKLHERLIELGVDSHFMSDDDVRSEKYTNWWGEKMFFIDKLDAWEESGLSEE
ncbi:MAG: glycosyl hydrolase, partial [Prolixibacteraceae bacterium]